MKKTKFYKMIYAATGTKKPQRRFKTIEAYNKTDAKALLKSLYKIDIKILEVITL
jgi:hypothetical protein